MTTLRLLLFLALLSPCWGQQSIALYSATGHTSTVTRTVELTAAQQARTYLVSYIMTGGVNPANIFDLFITFEDSTDQVNWIVRDRTVEIRDLVNGPLLPIVFVASARIEQPRRFVRATITTGQSSVAVAVTLERQ